MCRLFLIMAIMMANVLAMNAAKKTVINRIEPTNWYVGMKNPTVQLMVYGQGIWYDDPELRQDEGDLSAQGS